MNQLMKTVCMVFQSTSVIIVRCIQEIPILSISTDGLVGDGITLAGAGVWYYPLVQYQGISIRDVYRSSASPSYTINSFSESIL